MFVCIRELMNCSHVYTLNNGETFRLMAKQSKVIDNALVSPQMLRDSDIGEIIIYEVKLDLPKEPELPVVNKLRNAVAQEIAKEVDTLTIATPVKKSTTKTKIGGKK